VLPIVRNMRRRRYAYRNETKRNGEKMNQNPRKIEMERNIVQKGITERDGKWIPILIKQN